MVSMMQAPVLANPLTKNSLYQFFEATAAQYPERPFLNILSDTAKIYKIKSGKITYADMSNRIARLKDAYGVAGYGTGHRVGILVENRPEFFEHWFALNALGVSVVPINQDLRASELRYLIEHSELVLVVAMASRQRDLNEAGAPAVIGQDDDIPDVLVARQICEIGRDTEAALLYTSGTTGVPKGCVLTNTYFLNCGAWYRDIGGACAISEAGERMITPLPLFHMNAMACSTMAMIGVGGCLSVIDRFHPSSWWSCVREADATIMHYLGVMPAMLMNNNAEESDTNHSLRFGFGAGVEKSLHKPFEARFNIPLIEAWAMTETGNGAVIIASHGDRRVGTSCFGKPNKDVEVRLELDDGSEATRGEPGELLVRHAGENPRFGFFDRYLKNPEETEKSWLDGWFHTGDIVRQNSDGSMVFVDRKKNVIRRSGENIAAIEVEGILNHHPAVDACAVAPIPDPIRGDEVFACIKLSNPKTNNKDIAIDIVEHCLGQLAYYKAPGYIAFVDDLPLTSTNKIQRGVMKELVNRLRDSSETINCCHLKKRSTS